MNDNKDRLKFLKIDVDLFEKLFSTAKNEGFNRIVLKGIPNDAIAKRIEYDANKQSIEIVFQSDRFPDVNDGMQIPEVFLESTGIPSDLLLYTMDGEEVGRIVSAILKHKKELCGCKCGDS